MSANPTTCSNCGTENPPEADQCVQCGMPLTGSADEALRTQLEEQNDEGLLATREDVTTTGTGGGVGGGSPLLPPRPGD